MNNQQQPQSQKETRVDVTRGLSAQEVAQRVAAGQVNRISEGNTLSVGEIVRKHVFTLFNLINLALAVASVLVGELRDGLFFGIVIVNAVMGIAQELRAKKTLDNLSILYRGKVTVLREGEKTEIDLEELVLDDLVYLKSGNQVYADGIVVQASGMEVDESLLTGEADRIKKSQGDTLLSGSFVTAGTALMQITAIGDDSYANALTAEAKKVKRPTTPLMRVLNGIIRVLTFAIIPIGAWLFYRQYQVSAFDTAVLGTAASMIGMIPEGLILLTTVTLTVGAMRLAQKKALVQNLPSIETLARVDVLCLDKTGTITDGSMTLERVEPAGGLDEKEVRKIVQELMGALEDDNPTAAALRKEIGTAHQWQAQVTVPFSSARKWSAATFQGRGSYVLGAPAFVLPPTEQMAFEETLRQYTQLGHRVMAIAHAQTTISEDLLPIGLSCVGLVILSDTVRPEAPDTFRFFAEEGVCLKVISGDDPVAVSAIAKRAGIEDAESYVDMSQWEANGDFRHLVAQHTVFGRVSPEQKKSLVAALKAQGHTVCMTGDGVNDVLAMKEADCAVSMVSGSDAARGAAEFVLMTGDFSAMIEVLKEGRRVINNIEGVAAMYLVKTIYSVLLSVIYSIIPFPYPFAAVQMQPVNSFTVGIPSFVLALRNNFKRPEGKFLSNVMEHSVPAALTVVANALILQVAGILFDIPHAQTSSMTVLLTGFVGFLVLYKIARTGKLWLKAFIAVLAGIFVICTTNFFVPIVSEVIGPLATFLKLEGIWGRNMFFWIPLMVLSVVVFDSLNRFVCYCEERLALFKSKHRRFKRGKYLD